MNLISTIIRSIKSASTAASVLGVLALCIAAPQPVMAQPISGVTFNVIPVDCASPYSAIASLNVLSASEFCVAIQVTKDASVSPINAGARVDIQLGNPFFKDRASAGFAGNTYTNGTSGTGTAAADTICATTAAGQTSTAGLCASVTNASVGSNAPTGNTGLTSFILPQLTANQQIVFVARYTAPSRVALGFNNNINNLGLVAGSGTTVQADLVFSGNTQAGAATLTNAANVSVNAVAARATVKLDDVTGGSTVATSGLNTGTGQSSLTAYAAGTSGLTTEASNFFTSGSVPTMAGLNATPSAWVSGTVRTFNFTVRNVGTVPMDYTSLKVSYLTTMGGATMQVTPSSITCTASNGAVCPASTALQSTNVNLANLNSGVKNAAWDDSSTFIRTDLANNLANTGGGLIGYGAAYSPIRVTSEMVPSIPVGGSIVLSFQATYTAPSCGNGAAGAIWLSAAATNGNANSSVAGGSPSKSHAGLTFETLNTSGAFVGNPAQYQAHLGNSIAARPSACPDLEATIDTPVVSGPVAGKYTVNYTMRYKNNGASAVANVPVRTQLYGSGSAIGYNLKITSAHVCAATSPGATITGQAVCGNRPVGSTFPLNTPFQLGAIGSATVVNTTTLSGGLLSSAGGVGYAWDGYLAGSGGISPPGIIESLPALSEAVYTYQLEYTAPVCGNASAGAISLETAIHQPEWREEDYTTNNNRDKKDVSLPALTVCPDLRVTKNVVTLDAAGAVSTVHAAGSEPALVFGASGAQMAYRVRVKNNTAAGGTAITKFRMVDMLGLAGTPFATNTNIALSSQYLSCVSDPATPSASCYTGSNTSFQRFPTIYSSTNKTSTGLGMPSGSNGYSNSPYVFPLTGVDLTPRGSLYFGVTIGGNASETAEIKSTVKAVNDIDEVNIPAGSFIDFIWRVNIAPTTGAGSTTCLSGALVLGNHVIASLADGLAEASNSEKQGLIKTTFKCHNLKMTKNLAAGSPAVFHHGNSISFVLGVDNEAGGAAANGYVIRDQLSANIIIPQSTPGVPNAAAITCAPSTAAACIGYTATITPANLLSITTSTTGAGLLSGASVSFTIAGTIDTSRGTGSFTNVATIDTSTMQNAYDPDTSALSNSSSVVYLVEDTNRLSFQKRALVTTPDANGYVKYELELRNPTLTALTNYSIQDILNPSLYYENSTQFGVNYQARVTDGAGINIAGVGIPAPGASNPTFTNINLPASSAATDMIKVVFFARALDTSACGKYDNSASILDASNVVVAQFDGATNATDDVVVPCSIKLSKAFHSNPAVLPAYTRQTNGNPQNYHGFKSGNHAVAKAGEEFGLSFAFAIPKGVASSVVNFTDTLPTNIVLGNNTSPLAAQCTDGTASQGNVGNIILNTPAATATVVAQEGGSSIRINGITLPATTSAAITGSVVCTLTVTVRPTVAALNATCTAGSLPLAYTNFASRTEASSGLNNSGNIAIFSGGITGNNTNVGLIDDAYPTCVVVQPKPRLDKGFVTSGAAGGAAFAASRDLVYGEKTNLRIRITNPAFAGGSLPAFDFPTFSDTLPAEWLVAATPAISLSGCGVATASVAPAASGDVLTISAGTVASSTSALSAYCLIDIPVTHRNNIQQSVCAPVAGAPSAYTNIFFPFGTQGGTTTDNLTSEPPSFGATSLNVVASNACINVQVPPTLTKAYSAPQIDAGATTNLVFTITNPSGNLALTGLSFIDTLPAGIKPAATSATISGPGCTATTLTAAVATRVLTIAGLTVPSAVTGNQVCTITLPVTNTAGSTNTDCTANPAAFTNSVADNITSVVRLDTTALTPQCLVVMPSPKLVVSKAVIGTPIRTGTASDNKFEITYELTVQNLDPAGTSYNAEKVQIADNFYRTFSTATVVPTSIKVLDLQRSAGACLLSVNYASSSTATPTTIAAPLANSTAALLSGSDTLAPQALCTVQIKLEVDYGATAIPTMTTAANCTAAATAPFVPNPSQIGCNSAVASSISTLAPVGTVNAGWTIPNSPAAAISTSVVPANTNASDYSNNGTTISNAGTVADSKPTPTPQPALPGPVISKAFGSAIIGSNETNTVVFTLTAASAGHSAFTNIGLTDTLGAALNWTSASPTITYSAGTGTNPGLCTGPATVAAPNTVTTVPGGVLTIGAANGFTMPVGVDSCIITISGFTNATQGAAYPASGSGTNACSGSAGDNAYANAGLTVVGATTTQAANTPCVTVRPRSISVAKSQPVIVGSSPVANLLSTTADSEYTITVTNNSTSVAASGISIVENIPANLSYVGFSGTNWVCVASGSLPLSGPATVTCTLTGSIPASGANNALKIKVRLLASGLGKKITNIVTFNPDGTSSGQPTLATCTATPATPGCAQDATNVQVIDVVKSVRMTFPAAAAQAAAQQTGALTFTVPYTVKVKNTAATGGTLAYLFQAKEELKTTFSTGSPVISIVSGPTLEASSGPANSDPAKCALNTNFTGLGAVGAAVNNLFSGYGNLNPQDECVISFKVQLVYPTAASIPGTAQTNSIVVNTYGGPPSGPGANNATPIQATDTSTSATNSPGGPNSDTPSTTDVTFAVQQIDVAKAAGTVTPGTVTATSAKVKVAYKLIVKNNSATANASNVQLIDKLLGAGGVFANANNVVVTNFAITNSTPAPVGTCNVNTSTPNKTYSGSTDTLVALTGGDTLIPGASCVVTFDAEAEYLDAGGNAAAQVPATVNNTAFASIASSANPTGGSVDATGNFVSTGISGFIVSDASSNKNTGVNSGCSAAACLPTAGEAASPTPSTLLIPSIASAKSVGTVTQAAATLPAVAFNVPFTVRVQNTGNVILNNVQAIDDLRIPFPAGSGASAATFAVTTAPAFVSGTGQCVIARLNSAFNGGNPSAGTADLRLLDGNLTLDAGEYCDISFTATVTYTQGTVPANTPNQAFVSSATTPNNSGHGPCANTAGAITCVAPSGTVVASAKSDAGALAIGGNGNGVGTTDTTPVTFSAQRVDVTKARGTITPIATNSTAQMAFDVPFTLIVKNTGSVTATNVQVLDLMTGIAGSSSAFPSPAGVAVGAVTATPSAANTCTAGSYNAGTSVLTGLSGTNALAVGESCTITFTATVTYNQSALDAGDAASRVPTTAQNNTAYASSAVNSATIIGNTGGSFTAAGAHSPAANGVFVDASTDVTACVGAGCAAPTAAQTPSQTQTTLSAPAIGVAKAIGAAGVRQVAATAPNVSFTIPYVVRVQNTGNVNANNVQVVDYLNEPFNAATAKSVSTLSILSGTSSAAACAAALNTPAYNGVANPKLLNGSLTLTPSQYCDIAFTVTVTYTSASAAAGDYSKNTARASTATVANSAGYACTGTGAALSCTAPANFGVGDVSDFGTLATGTNGTGNGGTDADPTPVSLVAQRVDVTKEVGAYSVVNTPASVVITVPYTLRVKNTGAADATNVQVIDQMSGVGGTFTSGSVAVTGFTVTGPAACTAGAGYSSGTGKLTGLVGNTTLTANQECVVSFNAVVTYVESAAGLGNAANQVPSTVSNNTAYASVANAANNGGTVNAAGYVPDSTNLPLAADASTNVTGCPSACPAGVTGGSSSPNATDSASPTPITFSLPAIGSAKRLSGAATQVPSTAPTVVFNVPYIVKVQNTGNVALTNVQAIDDLRMPFPAPAAVTVPTAPSIVVASSSAACNAAMLDAAFNGTSNTKLMAGTTGLAVGEFCEIGFTATVTYPTFANVPSATTDLPNNAFVSSTTGVARNDGHTGCSVVGLAVSCTAPTTNLLAADKSDAGSNATDINAVGTTDSDSTLVRLATQKVDVTKHSTLTLVTSNPTQTVYNAVFTLRVKNTGTATATNVQVVDLLAGMGGTFPAPAVVTVAPFAAVLSTPSTAGSNCTVGSYAAGVLTGLSGSNSLMPGDMCTITFTAVVTYVGTAGIDNARSIVPASTSNTAYASSGTAAANTSGGSFDPATGAWTKPVGALSSDASTDVSGQTCPSAACNPVSTDTPLATGLATAAPALGSVKALVSSAQVGPTSFKMVFDLEVANAGNVPLYNVRMDDYLPAAFGAVANYSNIVITPVSGVCTTVSSSYNGKTQTNLISGTDTLAINASCKVRLSVDVDFGAGAIPAAMSNQALVSGMPTSVANPFTGGGTGVIANAPPLGTVSDKSDAGSTTLAGNNNPLGNNTGVPATTANNTPVSFDDPTPITAAYQEIGVTKAQIGVATIVSGPAPIQIRVPMQIMVKNTSATVVATNVQAIDNIQFAFPTPATLVDLAVQTGGGKVVLDAVASTGTATECAIYGGGVGSPLDVATGKITFMTGSSSLAPGKTCVYKFDVLATYANASAIPATGLTNSAFASTATGVAANLGGSVTKPANQGGPACVPAVASDVPCFTPPLGYLTKDTSVTGAQDPTSSDPTSGSPTQIALAVAQMAVAKSVATAGGNPVQVGAFGFDVPYSLVIKNTGNTVLTNLQLNDNLAAAFPAPAVISFAASPRVVATPAAAPCLANLAFDGTTDMRLLAGTGSLALGASCTITVTPRITYPDSAAYNAAAAATHDNSAFGSSATGSAANAGCASAAACASLANAQSFDQSDSGTIPDSSNDTAPGNSSGANKYQDPTPLSLPALNTVNGAVYIDRNANRTPDGVNEAPQSCYMVEVYNKAGRLATPPTPDVLIPYLRTVADANGHYSIPGVPSGPDFVIKFTPVPGVPGTPSCALPAVGVTVSNPVGGVGQNGNAGNAGNAAPVLAPTSPYYRRGEIPLMITSTTGGVQVANQNLPIDPAGVIYDSITRLPIAGAVVSIHYGSCAAGNLVPAADLDPSTPSNTVTTVAGGEYQFWFAAGSPPSGKTVVICVTPPAAYVPSALIPVSPALTVPATPSPYLVQPQMTAPQVGDSTTYHFVLNYPTGVTNDVLHNNIPLDPSVLPSLSVRKVGDKTTASMGDTVKYTITVKRDSATSMMLPSVSIVDTLPTGFKLIPGTVTLQNPTGGAVSVPVVAGVGPVLNIPVGALGSGVEATITYRVRVGVGAQLGNGKNTAAGVSGALKSSLASFTVVVTGGVFTSEGCVAGKVFVDCNNNHIQDKGEPGIPGVRLFMEDSTYFVTDSEGKYSYCGLTPTSHIIKVDPASLPLRARLTTSSNRNLGDAGSLMIDLRSGEFARGDFVEGSCTPSLLQEVKSRVGKDGAGTQLVLPKGEGTPDVHKTLDGLVLPKPAEPPKPLPGLKGVMSPVGVQK